MTTGTEAARKYLNNNDMSIAIECLFPPDSIKPALPSDYTCGRIVVNKTECILVLLKLYIDNKFINVYKLGLKQKSRSVSRVYLR